MARKVWKVVLNADRPCPQVHDLPFGARPLHVDRDTREGPHRVAVWFECDTDADPVGQALWVFGTDHAIPAGPQYVGTVVMGPFAWHVYCGKEK